MKKNYLNIILVIVFVIIWGAIIKKYFIKDNTENFVEITTPLHKYSYKKDIQKDTFQLKLINTNPFKVSARKKNKKQLVNNKVSKRNTIEKKSNKNWVWPEISYHGFVKSSDKKTKLVILKVDNKLYRKREKDKIRELMVVKAYKDSLIVSNNKKLKTIRKINETF